MRREQLVGQADAYNRSDERVRARRRQAEIPGAQVPDDRRAEQREPIAKPAAVPTCRISSTGNSETMPKATAPLDTRTPRKLNRPDQTTARFGGSEWV